MTGTAHRPIVEQFSTGASWLTRAIMVSTFLHLVVVAVWWFAHRPAEEKKPEYVDIEMAPPPPKAEALPAEVPKPPDTSPAAAATLPAQPEPGQSNEDDTATIDAGVDAPIDAPPKKKKRPDAAMVADQGDAGADAGALVASTDDAGIADGATDDGGTAIAMTDQGSGTSATAGYGAQEGAGSAVGSGGVAAAIEQGSGSGVAGMDSQPAVDGPPTSAGTAANLLAYFPTGHQVTALIRFDRLRGTEWAEPAEKLFQPMPDYQALFGARDAKINEKIDSLVISTPRPRDATATTLVVHSSLARAELRSFLDNTDTPIKWSATNGGLYGTRSGKLFPNDKRVLLSPWKGWVVLAQPADVVGLTTPSKASIDSAEVSAKTKLPPWLAGIRTIEQESEDPTPSPTTTTAIPPPTAAKPGLPTRGPALVLTLVGPGKRLKFPDMFGLGITSAPSPTRVSLAMELVKQGWLVRGNIVFATEKDATEFVQTAQDMQQRITDSRVLAGLFKKQHAYNAIAGFSFARAGARVSYATSLSIADARAVLAVMAATLDDYFQGQQP